MSSADVDVNKTNWLSNFDNNDLFWHIISTKSVELVYSRKKYYYNEWDQFLGPLTQSKYDKFQIQFECLKGEVYSISLLKTERLKNLQLNCSELSTHFNCSSWGILPTGLHRQSSFLHGFE